jgi:hypothetical protein
MFEKFFASIYYAARYFATGQAPSDAEIAIAISNMRDGVARRMRRDYHRDYTLHMDDEAVMLLLMAD